MIPPAGPEPAVLVLAQAPVPGQCKRQLEPYLGPEGCADLQRLLLRRAAGWAIAIAPGAAHLAVHPATARDEVAGLVPSDMEVFEQSEGTLGERLSSAVASVRDGAERLLIAGVDTPMLKAEHAAAALDDLQSGWGVSFGPSTDGGCYLLGLARPDRELLAGAVGAWSRSELMARALEATRAGSLSLALLRSERELHAPGDARALLADPLAPPDIIERLRPARWPRSSRAPG